MPKIKSVGRIKLNEKIPVYDLQIENTQNFVIDPGVCVHNTFVDCRNPDKHAIFPLKGKIPSIVNKKDILDHKEVKELIQAIGTGIEKNFDITKLRYNKIICATDADSDGYHIFCLLTMAIATLLPDIIKLGHYYLVITPLYAINESNVKNKTFIPIWTDEELNKAKSDKRHITRYKGLGELTPDQLEIVAINEQTRKLIPVKYTENYDELYNLFKNVDEKRKLLEEYE